MSWGEERPLALARGRAARPEFVVMDEPSSSIGALSEGAVSDAIENLPSGVTVVIVSHRRGFRCDCDTLAVTEDSRLSAPGTPKEVEAQFAYVRLLETGPAT